jgi:hypothetical protein
MHTRLGSGRRAVLVGLLTAGLAMAAVGGPADASTGPGLPTSTVVAGIPILNVDFTKVHVVATTPLWTFARTAAGPQVPVTWHTTAPLPADLPVTYDVEFRQTQGLDGPSFRGPWYPLLTGTTARAASLADYPNWVAQNGDAYEFVVRAVDPATGTAGPWSAPAASNIPLDDNWHNQVFEHGDVGDTRFGSRWTILASPYAYYGKQHTTVVRTFMEGGFLPWYGHRIYIFGTTCPTCGKFTIDLAGGSTGHTYTRPVTVDTYSAATHHRVVLYSADLPGLMVDLFHIETLATLHRPRVILDGWGVSH